MGFQLLAYRRLAPFVLGGFMAAAAGCQSGGIASVGAVLNPGASANDVADADVGDASSRGPVGKVRESELRAYCPRVAVREGDAYFNTYEGKGKKKTTPEGDEVEPDPSTLVYQSSIARVTRACSYGDGVMTVQVAAAGKVVPGPAAKDGTVTLPFRVEAKSGDGSILYTNSAKLDVAVSKTSGAAQFVFNDPNVSFPTPAPGTVQLFIGFDQGPQKKGRGQQTAQGDFDDQ